MNGQPGTTLYCAGLPFAGERPLTEDEVAMLRREGRRLRRRGWVIAFLLVMGLLPAIGVFTELLDTPWHDVAAVIGWVLLLAGLPLMILRARDAFRLARAMRVGSRLGRALCFAAPERRGSQWPEAEAARPPTAMGGKDEALWSLEILSGSGLLWRMNERPSSHSTLVTPTEVTNAPDFASTAAQWVRPWTEPDGETTWWNRRALSDAEHGELRKHVRRAIRPYFYLPLLTAYVSIGFFTGDWRESPWTSIPMWAVIAWADGCAIRVFPRVLRIRRDARSAMVIIFRPEDAAAAAAAPGSPALGPATEVLPFSRLPWTHDGQPAAWRKSRGG
jgi:hypothetical protein